MRRGIDTGFLVVAEVAEHPDHASARLKLAELPTAGDRFALTPQVLAEFIHIVTDLRRFVQPLDMARARDLAEQWWTARDVDAVFPSEAAVQQFLGWLRQYQLGRKRLLDTLLDAMTKPGRSGTQDVPDVHCNVIVKPLGNTSFLLCYLIPEPDPTD